MNDTATTPGKPRMKREGEKVGAGFFVFRRGRTSKRIKMSFIPFEHPTLESAHAEAERLCALHPGQTFEVFGTLMIISHPEATPK